MEVQIAVSKVGKYAAGESGDTLEMIERPGDGLATAGARKGKLRDVSAKVAQLHAAGLEAAQTWADRLLAEALSLDDGRAADDVSVLVVAVLKKQTPAGRDARRMLVTQSVPL